MKIVVLVDPEAVPEDDPTLEGHSESILVEMEYHVVEDLRLLGHDVEVVAFGPDIAKTIQHLEELKPRLVFNLTEHYGGDRRKDAYVAAVLELLGLRYTGTGPTGLMLCRDKATCKRILSHRRLLVPNFATLRVGRTRLKSKLQFPLIVKPVFEDGSDGISLASLVTSDAELTERVRMIHERMSQPAICEEYIEGREVYVGVIGNKRLQAFPARELHFSKDTGPTFATARVKQDDDYRTKWGITYRHANLPKHLEEKVARISKRIYRLLHIQDYGRIDLRITPDERVVFLEANPNPELTMGDDLAEAAQKAGIDHQDLIRRIVRHAVHRS